MDTKRTREHAFWHENDYGDFTFIVCFVLFVLDCW